MIALAKPDNRIDALPLGVVVHGDALAVLKTMESNSVDAIVTDPPAGISFMGKEWDTFSPEYLEHESEYRKRIRKPTSLGAQEYNGVKKKRSGSAFCGPANYAGNYDLSRKGRDAFVKMMTDIMAEALRVLKPGGHALVWALPRTSHWTALALEDAGFEIRDCVYHITGQGFPKSTAIDKQIDKRLRAEREVVGVREDFAKRAAKNNFNQFTSINPSVRGINSPEFNAHMGEITAPATPEAAQWDGWGTALKPAVECWWLCRKPLAEPSIAANVLKYGTGGINVDACRVGNETVKTNAKRKGQSFTSVGSGQGFNGCPETTHQGRWPANLLLSHSLWCTPNGTKRVQLGGGQPIEGNPRKGGTVYDGLFSKNSSTYHGDPDGMEEVEAWHCAEDCPIRLLDEQSGVRKSVATSGVKRANGILKYNGTNARPSHNTFERITEQEGYNDQGGASRYFQNLPPDVPFYYTAKASRSERNAGCEGLPEAIRGALDGERVSNTLKGPTNMLRPDHATVSQNNHPTVKPLALMRWLVRLVTPPDGIVLDPFLGSGSTAVAAIQEGYHFIGIEQDASYVAISEARIAHARREVH